MIDQTEANRDQCECSACGGCDEPAVTFDHGVPLCAGCADYTVDDEGDVLCSQCPGTEHVTESCGAGRQTRTYLRPSPPAMPESDPDGPWAVVWDTAGDDGHIVSRHATRELAEQAVAAHDWPPPGDHTAYLCGYAVVGPDEDD